jgi:hypothetical protein
MKIGGKASGRTMEVERDDTGSGEERSRTEETALGWFELRYTACRCRTDTRAQSGQAIEQRA